MLRKYCQALAQTPQAQSPTQIKTQISPKGTGADTKISLATR